MDETKNKVAFAAFLLKTPDTPLQAALEIYPDDKDRGKACKIAFAWPDDPIVIAEMHRLVNEVKEEDEKVPSKDEVVIQLWKLAQSDKVAPKDRATCARIVGEMLNYIKPSELDINAKRMPTAPVYKIVEA